MTGALVMTGALIDDGRSLVLRVGARPADIYRRRRSRRCDRCLSTSSLGRPLVGHTQRWRRRRRVPGVQVALQSAGLAAEHRLDVQLA